MKPNRIKGVKAAVAPRKVAAFRKSPAAACKVAAHKGPVFYWTEEYHNRQEKESRRNYEILHKQRAVFQQHKGEYALMRDGEILDFYGNISDAITSGNDRFEDRIFSTIKVTKEVVSCPFVSYEP